ncbi:MAG: NmrA family NAD(P)-binding protein, partial [Runella zeae]
MNTKPIIAVVGATGRLAQPVVRELLLQGFQVRAIVRDIAKAQKTLPSAVTLAQGNVADTN